MNVTRLIRRAGGVALAVLLVMLGCRSDPMGPRAAEIYIEVHVTGGFADVDYTFAVVGSSSELRAIDCVRACEFEGGELLVELTPAQVLYVARLLDGAGFHGLDGTDFGDQCCDQFHYGVEYRDGMRTARVSGAFGRLPEDLAHAIGELHQLLSGALPILIDWESTPEAWPRDVLTLSDYSLDGPILSLEVEYGGGCASHDLDLVAWGGWLESFPVQVNVLLSHEDHDDPCDALIRRTVRFDLTHLAEEYLRSYPSLGPGPTTIVLRLSVPDGEGTRQLDYVF